MGRGLAGEPEVKDASAKKYAKNSFQAVFLFVLRVMQVIFCVHTVRVH